MSLFTNAAVAPLFEVSDYWASTDIKLEHGEAAWEIIQGSRENPARVFMLRGDGRAVNPDYTRLRVTADSFIITGEHTIKQELEDIQDRIAVEAARLDAKIDALDTGLNAKIETVQENLDNEAAGLITAIESVAAESLSADAALQGAIDAEAAEREQADIAFSQSLEEFTQETIGEIAGLKQKDIQHDEEIEALGDRFEEYAPILAPQLEQKADPQEKEDVPSAPSAKTNNFRIKEQIATVEDLEDKCSLLSNMSNNFFVKFGYEVLPGERELDLMSILMRVGRDLKPDGTEYELELFELGNSWQEPPVTQDEWRRLYDMVVSTTGDLVVAVVGEDKQVREELYMGREGIYQPEAMEYGASCCNDDPFSTVEWENFV